MKPREKFQRGEVVAYRRSCDESLQYGVVLKVGSVTLRVGPVYRTFKQGGASTKLLSIGLDYIRRLGQGEKTGAPE